ncbi:alpha/beta-hydrolase [Pluteus cervinus]|uniref:Alpha/beta-hydrolase n=1 Tax=Pluteus cervinus TaxID=181527 RepID=A0ACD3ABH2_9AGAR|nr:alpha/beta-hydrolase [Pluteus cervinus]
MKSSLLGLSLLVSVPAILATPTPRTIGPIVKLSYGSFQGAVAGNVTTFLGVPFAAPPVGNLRFAPPQPPIPFKGIQDASNFGAACFQQDEDFPLIFGMNESALIASDLTNGISEDCLFINVVTPSTASPGQKLPVLFWIFGGGFEEGDTSENPGNTVVERSLSLDQDVVYVSANYRTSAFGFLGGQEAKDAGLGNAGLRDQRFAMEWVQQHISAFGGDPQKVTIWGESAGAIAVGLHLVINDGNPQGLFRGAFMESGSPIPLEDITAKQGFFDQLVADTGCTGSANLIACLRALSFEDLSNAIDQTPGLFAFQSLNTTWGPSVDGEVIVRDPQVSVLEGKYAKVPFVTGDCDDEGTLFALSSLNITTDAEFLNYISTNYLPGVGAAQLNLVAQAYPNNPAVGSPFGTGDANEATPEFKRIAAVQGDMTFQAPRRFFLRTASKTQPTFAFLFKRGKDTEFLGSFHGSDIPEFYGTGTPDFIGTDALINFAHHLNPNAPTGTGSISLLSQIHWPEYASNGTHPPLFTFLDPAPSVAITDDTFRVAAMDLLMGLSLEIDGNS